MSKVLLVDTNRASIPTYRALLAFGHEVWVTGSKSSEPLAKMCPKFIQADYSNSETLEKIVKEQNFNYIVPGCTDVSYNVCARINHGQFPGIDTVETTEKINNKQLFRAAAEAIGLPVPRTLHGNEKNLPERVIVKPVDSFSGRGIAIVEKPTTHSLGKAFEEAKKTSRSGTCVLEEFVGGQLFSHSAFLQSGEIIADFFVQEDCVINPFSVDTSRVEWSPGPGLVARIQNDVSKMARTLGLVDGLLHTQFISCGEKYWIIECTRRCPGDLYSLLIEKSDGYPYASNYAAPFVGVCAQKKKPSLAKFIIRHTAAPRRSTPYLGIQFQQPVELSLFVPLVSTGEILEAGIQGRAALMFLACTSKAEQDCAYAKLLEGTLYTFL